MPPNARWRQAVQGCFGFDSGRGDDPGHRSIIIRCTKFDSAINTEPNLAMLGPSRFTTTTETYFDIARRIAWEQRFLDEIANETHRRARTGRRSHWHEDLCDADLDAISGNGQGLIRAMEAAINNVRSRSSARIEHEIMVLHMELASIDDSKDKQPTSDRNDEIKLDLAVLSRELAQAAKSVAMPPELNKSGQPRTRRRVRPNMDKEKCRLLDDLCARLVADGLTVAREGDAILLTHAGTTGRLSVMTRAGVLQVRLFGARWADFADIRERLGAHIKAALVED